MLLFEQLLSVLSQIRKVVNHPKQIVLKRDEMRIMEANKVKSAQYAGCDFVKVSSEHSFPSVGSKEWVVENELRSLTGELLIKSW